MNFRMLALAGSAIALAACATQTPYGPVGPNSQYGYQDTKIEDNRYRVSFSGNSLTGLDTVETYLLYRASELTLQNGFDWFEVVGRNVEKDRRYRGTSYDNFGYFGYGYGLRYYHPYYGWRPYGRGFSDIDIREITNYQAVAEIRLGSGEKPAANARAYDAREVQRNLSTQIQLPGY